MNVLTRTRLFAVPLPCCTTCRTNTTHQHPSTAKPKALKLQTRRDLDATRLHIPEWIKLYCHVIFHWLSRARPHARLARPKLELYALFRAAGAALSEYATSRQGCLWHLM